MADEAPRPPTRSGDQRKGDARMIREAAAFTGRYVNFILV